MPFLEADLGTTHKNSCQRMNRRKRHSLYLRPLFQAFVLVLAGMVLGWLACNAWAAGPRYRAVVSGKDKPLVAMVEKPSLREVRVGDLIYLGTFTATAYCSCPKCCGVWSQYNLTASGTTPEVGRTVAADWSVLPAGSEVYIDGVGWRTVEDTGSGVNGQWLDLYMDSHQAALEWGRQEVEVWTRA